jgi:hypothetical protein
MRCGERITLEKERDAACRPNRKAGNAGGTAVTREVMRRDTSRCLSAEQELKKHIDECPTCKANATCRAVPNQ